MKKNTGRNVGAFTDLGEMGAIFLETGEKTCHGVVMGFSWFRGAQSPQNDSYDDLLLPMHRWFAQIVIEASGEHLWCASVVEQPRRRCPGGASVSQEEKL